MANVIVVFPRALKEGVYYVCAGLANGHLVIYDETLLTVS